MKNKSPFFLSAILAAALWSLLATGCNTMQGAGKDIEKGGEKLQDAAQRNK